MVAHPIVVTLVALWITSAGQTPIEGDVLLLDLRATGTAASDAAIITAEVAERLATHEQVKILTVADLDAAASLQSSLFRLGCHDEGCLAEISRATEVRYVLSGSVGQVGAATVVSLHLFDAEAARAIGAASRELASPAEALDAVPELLSSLFGWPDAPAPARRYRLAQGEDVSFAVFDLEPLGLAPETADNLTQVLAVELKSIEGATVVSRSDIASLLQLEAEKERLDCGAEASCWAEIGGALGVDKLVAGHVGKIGPRFVVSLRLLDTRAVRVDARVTESFVGHVDQLIRAVRVAGRDLLGLTDDEGGTLALAANLSEATVFVDNLEIGTLPMPPVPGLPPGRHAVRITRSGYLDWQSDVYVEPGETTALWAEIEEGPTPWYRSWWFWTGVGAVVAGVVVTTAILLMPKDLPENGAGVAIIEAAQGAAP